MAGLHRVKVIGYRAYFCVTGIYHDAIECYALFGEGECELEMFGISCMVEVDGDRYGGLVGAAERSVE